MRGRDGARGERYRCRIMKTMRGQLVWFGLLLGPRIHAGSSGDYGNYAQLSEAIKIQRGPQGLRPIEPAVNDCNSVCLIPSCYSSSEQ